MLPVAILATPFHGGRVTSVVLSRFTAYDIRVYDLIKIEGT